MSIGQCHLFSSIIHLFLCHNWYLILLSNCFSLNEYYKNYTYSKGVVSLASEKNIKTISYLNLGSNLHSNFDDIHSALGNFASRKQSLCKFHWCCISVINRSWIKHFSHIKFSITVCATFGDHIWRIVKIITRGTPNHIATWL